MRTRTVLVLTCVIVACNGEHELAAGPDASAIDAGLDASDAGLDVSAIDAGPPTDAWLSPDDPGWTRLPGFPDECFVERARQPQAVLAFHWAPCLDALPGCQMAVIDRSVARLQSVGSGAGGNDGREILVWWLVPMTPSGAWGPYQYWVVTRADVAVAAWRFPQNGPRLDCGGGPVTSSEGIALNTWWNLAASAQHAGYVSVAPWSDLARLDAPMLTSSETLWMLFSVSATTLASGPDQSGEFVAVEPPRFATVGHGRRFSPSIAVGHSVLWDTTDATGTSSSIHRSTIDGPDTVVYTAAPFYLTGADGTWLTWATGTIGPNGYATFDELWAAPYSETPPLTPRRLWTAASAGTRGTWEASGFGGSGRIGDGMFAYLGTSPPTTVRVVDLAGRTRREYAMPPLAPNLDGWSFTLDPAWVTRDEVVVPAHRVAGGDTLETVVRIDLRALPLEILPGS